MTLASARNPKWEAQYRWRERNPERSRNTNRRAEVNRREHIRSMLVNYKLDNGCVDCGDRWQAVAGAYPEALEFDHPSGLQGRQRHEIRLTNSNSYTQTLRELEHVEVVCSICHSMRTKARKDGRLS